MPETIEVSMTPAIIGSMSSPEPVTSVPAAICMNVGRNAIAENMPSPSSRPMTVESTKVGFLNSPTGMIGFDTLDSTKTNSAAATMVPMISEMIVGEFQS